MRCFASYVLIVMAITCLIEITSISRNRLTLVRSITHSHPFLFVCFSACCNACCKKKHPHFSIKFGRLNVWIKNARWMHFLHINLVTTLHHSIISTRCYNCNSAYVLVRCNKFDDDAVLVSPCLSLVASMFHEGAEHAGWKASRGSARIAWPFAPLLCWCRWKLRILRELGQKSAF